MAQQVYTPAERMALYKFRNRVDPVQYIHDALGVTLWDKQAEIFNLIRQRRFVSVRSANGVGKSYVASCAVPWYLNSYAPSYVITTSSSWTSLEKILWPKIHTIVNNAPLEELRTMGRLLDLEWKLGDEWGAFALSPNLVENFAGFRPTSGVLIIVDEASALSQDIYDAIMGLCSHINSKVLLIGNPLRPSGPFFETFRSRAWATLHISAFDCPNVIEGREVIPGLTTRLWIDERREEWGEDSPIYQSRVLGNFPKEDEHTLIPLWLAEESATRHRDMLNKTCDKNGTRLQDDPEGEIRIGADIAEYGDDKTVIAILKGNTVIDVIVRSKQDLMTTVGMIVDAIRKYKPIHVNVDEIGLGTGVRSRLHELGHKKIVNGVNVSNSVKEPDLFNLRAKLWFNFKEWLELGGRIPDDKRIIASVSSARYLFDSGTGARKVEKKEITKSRLGHSPDIADALMLATYHPERKGPIAW
jgi:hypothetical protein